jgi:hypothetical protein
LDKASNGPAHLRTTFLKRAVLDFERFLDIFSSLPPSSLPSFRYSLPPPFPKRVCLLGWPYLESRTTSQTKPPSNFDLDAFLARVIADKDNSHVRNQQQQHLSRDVYGLYPFLDFNSYWINVWPWFFLHSNGTSLDDTFKLDVYLDLRLIYGWFFTPRQKKDRDKWTTYFGVAGSFSSFIFSFSIDFIFFSSFIFCFFYFFFILLFTIEFSWVDLLFSSIILVWKVWSSWFPEHSFLIGVLSTIATSILMDGLIESTVYVSERINCFTMRWAGGFLFHVIDYCIIFWNSYSGIRTQATLWLCELAVYIYYFGGSVGAIKFAVQQVFGHQVPLTMGRSR